MKNQISIKDYLDRPPSAGEDIEIKTKIQVAIMAIHLKAGIVKNVEEWMEKIEPIVSMLFDGAIFIGSNDDWHSIQEEKQNEIMQVLDHTETE
jgi:hypothetical protein